MFCLILGDEFNPKTFHQAILDVGSCPLKILEEEINHWIAQQPITSSAASISLWHKLVVAVLVLLRI